MPFTFSHPALVLPLTIFPRHWFSLTGLVIGSLTPDFKYFLRMRIQSVYSHTVAGIFWFDLPLGILLTFLYHNFVRNELISNLPFVLRSRLFRFIDFDWNQYFKTNWLIVSVSIIIGAASHLLWDSFTHESGYFVSTMPKLTETVGLLGKQIPFYKISQHFSTVLGGIIIAFAILKLPADKNVKSQTRTGYWIFVAALTLIIVVTRILFGLDIRSYGHLVASFMSAGLIALVMTPIVASKRINGGNSTQPPGGQNNA